MNESGAACAQQTSFPTKCRMPAEWEPHEATWIAWPHNRTDWPGKIDAVRWAYVEMARKIAGGEKLRILVHSDSAERQARRMLSNAGVDPAFIEYFHFPTNRGWTRDSGPLFIRCGETPGELAIARFSFNAWARYPDWQDDNEIPVRAGQALNLPLYPVCRNGRLVVLEGGSIDVNGRGSLLTSEECLLDRVIQARNPDLSREELDIVLRETLGATNVLWLGSGIEGDDTHGHVDDICRFVGPETVVLCREKNSADPNHRVLAENRERLQGMRLENGSRIEVIPLPMPAPLYFRRQRLPASYANFYIANSAVLVPTFNDASDRTALGILGELFHDRPVIGIHAVDLVWGLGTLHCLTQQQPRIER